MANPDLLDPRLRSPKVTASASSHLRGHLDDDDESEWEYEYSATQTETFYVTLDLSKADFKSQEHVVKNPPPVSRIGLPAHGANASLPDGRKTADQASHNSVASSAGSSDGEHDAEGAPDVGIHDDHPVSNERVQILDLHSENPVVSYKGRVYSGQWCENTTTELLLARHNDQDTDDHIPVLRHLDDGVDLLAASASRIIVAEQNMNPKTTTRELRQRATTHLPQTVIPPVDPKASQERIDQRNFLADLITLKRRKGETDDVTIIARSMQGRRERADTGTTKSTRTIRRGHRVLIKDRPDPLRTELQERPRRGGRRKGSGRTRGKWALFPLETPTEARDAASVNSSAAHSLPPDDGSGTSAPTPLSWAELGDGPRRSSRLSRLQTGRGLVEAGEAEDGQDEDEAGSNEEQEDEEEEDDEDDGEDNDDDDDDDGQGEMMDEDDDEL